MKKLLCVLVILLTTVALICAAGAKEKKNAKSQTQKAMVIHGTVTAYEEGKVIKVKAGEEEREFDIAADAKVKGQIKEGAEVRIRYKKEGDKMVATSVSGTSEKKKTKKKDETSG
jgi:hypothetical protein